MKKMELKVGDVVQLSAVSETVRPEFRGVFMVVTDPKSFGAQGYCPELNDADGLSKGLAYYRANFADMEYVGRATWFAT